MSRAAPRDSNARSHAVNHGGSVLVQAPAGSGKTMLLTQRYLRLLANVDAPERILALTFTRMAAEEMRQRVIIALSAAELPQCPPGFNADTWELGVAARDHLRSLRIDVERQPSRLRIETIDSFNAWLAAQLPIASGAGGRLSLLEDAHPSYEEAAKRALAHDREDSFGEAVERTLAVGDQRWRQLVGMIADMLGGRDRWLALLAGPMGAATAPGIFAGLRLSLIYAWLGTLGAEYFMPSNGGIGALMIGAQQLLRMDVIMSGMLVVGLTGALINLLGQHLETRATRWRHA